MPASINMTTRIIAMAALAPECNHAYPDNRNHGSNIDMIKLVANWYIDF